jgi:hypothetical protein
MEARSSPSMKISFADYRVTPDRHVTGHTRAVADRSENTRTGSRTQDPSANAMDLRLFA